LDQENMKKPFSSLVPLFLGVLFIAVSTNGSYTLFSQAIASTTHTAGRTTIGPVMYTGQQNVMSASQVTTGAETGLLNSISVYVGEVHAAPLNHMQVAIYADDGTNAPGNRIANSSTEVLTANSWNVFPMPSITVAANKNYWLVFNVDGSGTRVPIVSSVARSTWRYPISYGTWPSLYGMLSRPVEAKQYSIYMTYTSVGITPSPSTTIGAPIPPPTSSGGTAGCGLPITPGAATKTITVNGVQRTYLVVIPAGLNPTTPTPIVMGFHGGNSTADYARQTYGLEGAEAVIYVYPQAEPFADAWAAWNVDPAGLDFPYFDTVITDLGKRHCVDTERVFATGKSNGAFFVNSLACYRPNVIRAIASVAGGGPQGNCTAAKAAMIINGSADAVVPISTGMYSRDYWLAANGYSGAPSIPVNPPPCVSYPGTFNPVLWCQHGGGHDWPTWAGAGVRNFFLSL
jgi:polyhydroxybutyrate depolymerase